MTNIVFDMSTDNTKPLSIFLLPQYWHRMKRFFQRVTIAWQIDANTVVCSLLDNGKLANRIATLLPIAVKTSNISSHTNHARGALFHPRLLVQVFSLFF